MVAFVCHEILKKTFGNGRNLGLNWGYSDVANRQGGEFNTGG